MGKNRDLVLNIGLQELKRLINQYFGQNDNDSLLLRSELLIDIDHNQSKLLVDKDAERLFLSPCRREIPNGIVTPVVRTEYYTDGNDTITMVQRFLNNDDIEQILKYYEERGLKAKGTKHKSLTRYRQKERKNRAWDNSKPDSHPYYEE